MRIEMFTPVAGESNTDLHLIGNDLSQTLSGKIALMRDMGYSHQIIPYAL